MLRLRLVAQAALFAIALCTTAPAVAQQSTSDRIEAAEKKLDADIKACRPINPAESKELLDETHRNVTAAKAAAKAGAPVDVSKLNSDLSKASALYKRASDAAAAAKPCPPPQQQPQSPKQSPAPPKLVPVQPGGIAGGIELDPWTAMKVEAWDLFDELDEAMWDCDLDTVKKLIPELQDLQKRVREAAQAAKAAGKFSKIKPEDAQKLADSIQDAIDDAEEFKGCPLFKLVPEPKTAPKKEEPKPKPTPNDLFKPPEKPTPPRHSIVEDLVEPPTAGELKTLDDALREMDKLGKAMKGAPGCDPKTWAAHVKRLELIAKRTRQIADWAKTPGQTTGVDPKEAERVANEAQKQLDETKKAPVVDCPKTTPQPKQEPKTDSSHSSVPMTPAQELRAIEAAFAGIGVGLHMSRGQCEPDKWNAAIAYLDQKVRRAQEIADTAKAAGPYSSIKPEEAQKKADEFRQMLDNMRAHPPEGCPGGQSLRLSQPAEQILAIHNVERAAVGAPALRWDPLLAEHATAYAQELARTGQLTHAPREGRGIERENLGQGRLGWSPDQIVRNEWLSEKRSFHGGYFPNVCSGDWTVCAHYSQMIWPTTTDIGCGWAAGGGFEWLVCRYSPGGNKDGKPVGLPYVPERG